MGCHLRELASYRMIWIELHSYRSKVGKGARIYASTSDAQTHNYVDFRRVSVPNSSSRMEIVRRVFYFALKGAIDRMRELRRGLLLPGITLQRDSRVYAATNSAAAESSLMESTTVNDFNLYRHSVA